MTAGTTPKCSDLGPQYDRDDDFKRAARLHQSRFRVEQLHAGYHDYGNRLAEAAALQGCNFYGGLPEIYEAVKMERPLQSGAPAAPLYYDMLRSEHIPYNFFVPLRLDLAFAKRILNHFLDDRVADIQQIKIEYPPSPKECYLDDNTSFDVYVAYDDGAGRRGGIGIEVKYTEREYPYGPKEKRQVESPDSPYNRVTRRSGLYKDQFAQKLKEPRFKQVWRNQLLGEAVIQNRDIEQFVSVLLYPAGNHHFVSVCDQYSDGLKPDKSTHFKAIQFGDFIRVAETKVDPDAVKFKEWLSYLKARYIVR